MRKLGWSFKSTQAKLVSLPPIKLRASVHHLDSLQKEMGFKLEFCFCLYDYIVREAKKLESRLPKWIVAWISVEYCLLMFYIVGMGVFWGLVLLCVPNKTSEHVKLIDAMFNSFSAVTGSGLASVSMSSLSTFQLFVLMLLCLIGAKVFTTLLELILRLALTRRRRSSTDKEDCVGEHNESHVMDLHDTVVRTVSGDVMQDKEGVPDGQTDGESFRSQKIHPESYREKVQVPPQSDKSGEFGDFVLGKTKLTLYRPYRSDGDVLTSIRLRHKKNKWENGLGALFQSEEAPATYKGKENSWKMEEITIKEDVEDIVYEEKVFGYLARIVFTYWVGVQFAGGVLAAIYFAAKQSARAHVKDSGGNVVFFTVFMTISHFANAGYAPINAGMTPFTKDLVLQIIFAGQMLLGNTMFPVALRVVVWMANKWSKEEKKGAIFDDMLRNPGRFCGSLYPKKQTIWLVMVTVGCITLLVSLVLGLMWNDEMVNGFSWWEKFVNAVYQSISARHTGVNVWNLGEWTPTVLYAFILIMYVPGQPIYASQDHTISQGDEDDKISFQSKKFLFQYSVFVAVAILLICIIENHNIVSDSFNFSVFNIVLEVVSAFMNVGLSVGYSCSLRKTEGTCVDVPYSFSGKWSPANGNQIQRSKSDSRARGQHRAPGERKEIDPKKVLFEAPIAV
ncbi:hypothetical protein SUGI_0973430 [Cryptomeria japonica]|nr:hypothetical protein SUGI_0973430 [Cryptomeria japonica]